MKKIFLILCCSIPFFAVFFMAPKAKTQPSIGIIVPMEHAALHEMIQGFLSNTENVRVKVLNAQGDATLQKSIIEQLTQEGCDLLVPIGTQTSQMTLHTAKQSNVLCLAANPDILQSSHPSHVTVLDDECSVQKAFHLLTSLFPDIKKIALVHSASDKVYQDILPLEEIAQEKNIRMQKLLVSSLPDLYNIAGAIADDCDAVFVVKDHLIVSGIPTLVKQANTKKLIVITSDNGSVAEGATLAIGIKELDIGKEGGSPCQTNS